MLGRDFALISGWSSSRHIASSLALVRSYHCAFLRFFRNRLKIKHLSVVWEIAWCCLHCWYSPGACYTKAWVCWAELQIGHQQGSFEFMLHGSDAAGWTPNLCAYWLTSQSWTVQWMQLPRQALHWAGLFWRDRIELPLLLLLRRLWFTSKDLKLYVRAKVEV